MKVEHYNGSKEAVDELFKEHSLPPFLSLIGDGARIGVKVR